MTAEEMRHSPSPFNIVFVAKKPVGHLFAFDMPLVCITFTCIPALIKVLKELLICCHAKDCQIHILLPKNSYIITKRKPKKTHTLMPKESQKNPFITAKRKPKNPYISTKRKPKIHSIHNFTSHSKYIPYCKKKYIHY